jgi:succinate dehydrogenase / fumarate reductase cytochrome b subunit
MFLLKYWQSTIGKKTVMALTGLMLFGFIVAHMLGNMQIFIGPEAINHYAISLRKLGALLWVARLALLLALSLHVLAAVQLTLRNRRARPIGYRLKESPGTNYAARTMMVSGVLGETKCHVQPS